MRHTRYEPVEKANNIDFLHLSAAVFPFTFHWIFRVQVTQIESLENVHTYAQYMHIYLYVYVKNVQVAC